MKQKPQMAEHPLSLPQSKPVLYMNWWILLLLPPLSEEETKV